VGITSADSLTLSTVSRKAARGSLIAKEDGKAISSGRSSAQHFRIYLCVLSSMKKSYACTAGSARK